MAGQLPDDIVQSIAISNAKSISEQPEGSLEARSAVGDGHVRLGNLELYIDGNGRLVVESLNPTTMNIFIPGAYSREDIQVVLESSRGVTVRLRKNR